MSNLEGQTVSPINYLKIFFKRKELIFIPVFAGLIIGICTGFLLPKKYKSSTIILVQEAKSDNPLFNKLAISTTIRQRMVGIKESILGWNSLVELVKRLKLDRDVKTKFEFEGLIEGLRKNVLINLRGNNIISLSYIGSEPEMTQAIVKNITDIFIDKNIQIQNEETSDAIKFIEEQLQVYKGKIKSAEIARLQDELDLFLVDSTEKHPFVKRLREQVSIQKEELRKENLEYTENINFNIETTKPMINEITKALDTLTADRFQGKDPYNQGSESAKFLVSLDLDKVVARDINVNERIYNTLLERIESAKITQRLQSSKEGTKYTVLDPPRVPLGPFKPNKVLVVLMGMLCGCGAGVGLVFFSELVDKSFIDVEEAKDYLGVALFGAISKINTPESLRREKEKDFWLYGLALVVGIITVVVTAMVADYLK